MEASPALLNHRIEPNDSSAIEPVWKAKPEPTHSWEQLLMRALPKRTLHWRQSAQLLLISRTSHSHFKTKQLHRLFLKIVPSSHWRIKLSKSEWRVAKNRFNPIPRNRTNCKLQPSDEVRERQSDVACSLQLNVSENANICGQVAEANLPAPKITCETHYEKWTKRKNNQLKRRRKRAEKERKQSRRDSQRRHNTQQFGGKGRVTVRE